MAAMIKNKDKVNAAIQTAIAKGYKPAQVAEYLAKHNMTAPRSRIVYYYGKSNESGASTSKSTTSKTKSVVPKYNHAQQLVRIKNILKADFITDNEARRLALDAMG